MPPTDKSALSPDQSVVLRYAGATMAALAALGLRMVLDPVLGIQAPYLLFIIPIVVVTRYGGRGPGLTTTGISALAVDWFYLQPSNSLAIADPNARAALALFVLTGIIISFLVGRPRKPLPPRQTEEQIHFSPGSTAASRGADRRVKPHHLWLGAAVLLLAIESLLFVGTWTRFAERESLFVRTREVLARIESLLSELKDAETGQRGYLLSGQDSYLAPYNTAVQTIPGQLADLRKVSLDPEQQARIASLQPLIAAKLAELKETIDLRQSGAAAAALQVLSSDRGKQLMDRIRDGIAAMRVAEASRLEERSHRAAAAARGMGIVMASGAGLLLIVLLAGSRDIDRNLTRRQRAQQELRESEARYRNLFESMDEGFAECEMIYDAEGRPIDYRHLALNPAFSMATGLAVEQVVGRTVSEVIPELEPFWIESYARVVRTGESERSANPVAALGRQFESFVWRSGPGRFAVVLNDVTERKRSEEVLLRMSAMVESSDDAIIGKTLEGVITSWNLGAARLYGYTAPEAIGRNVSALLPAGCSDETAAILRRLAIGERIEQLEAVRRRKDGSLVDVSLKISPIVDASGNVVGASTIARDVTERKQAEDEIRRLNAGLEDRVRQRTAQLEAANKELEAFAYSVSHDLRAPLRGIDGWSLALVEDYASQLDERAHGYVDRVRAETQRMGTLIDDLLQLSRVTRSEMAMGTVDLTSVAQTIAARLTEDNAGRRIEFQVAGGLATNGDARLLGIALDNLLSNAVKFTGPRTEARIEFGRTERDGERPFYVRDNGVGFDMTFAGTLFGAFQRLHKTTEFPGTGIGLATVQRIIHRHGGRVWAEARPDLGATFYFTLGGL
ncbi:MAG TPA: CHASE3 domain-containing protein [Bryobacteraceae bacterium]|nr:CHASE3 domain-containing protein [Bryobacteraceae bacterium]